MYTVGRYNAKDAFGIFFSILVLVGNVATMSRYIDNQHSSCSDQMDSQSQATSYRCSDKCIMLNEYRILWRERKFSNFAGKAIRKNLDERTKEKKIKKKRKITAKRGKYT